MTEDDYPLDLPGDPPGGSSDEATPPEWMRDLLDCLAEYIFADETMPPLGCHFCFDAAEDQWEISLFLSATIIMGGPEDGARVHTPFVMELEALQKCLTPGRVYYQSDPIHADDEVGGHLGVEGTFKGQKVLVRVLAAPPSHCEPGRELDYKARQLKNRWS